MHGVTPGRLRPICPKSTVEPGVTAGGTQHIEGAHHARGKATRAARMPGRDHGGELHPDGVGNAGFHGHEDVRRRYAGADRRRQHLVRRQPDIGGARGWRPAGQLLLGERGPRLADHDSCEAGMERGATHLERYVHRRRQLVGASGVRRARDQRHRQHRCRDLRQRLDPSTDRPGMGEHLHVPRERSERHAEQVHRLARTERAVEHVRSLRQQRPLHDDRCGAPVQPMAPGHCGFEPALPLRRLQQLRGRQRRIARVIGERRHSSEHRRRTGGAREHGGIDGQGELRLLAGLTPVARP
jgi:hypothetical protein